VKEIYPELHILYTNKICADDIIYFVHCQWKVTTFGEFVVGNILNLYEELNFLPFRTLREIWNIYTALTITKSVKPYIWTYSSRERYLYENINTIQYVLYYTEKKENQIFLIYKS